MGTCTSIFLKKYTSNSEKNCSFLLKMRKVVLQLPIFDAKVPRLGRTFESQLLCSESPTAKKQTLDFSVSLGKSSKHAIDIMNLSHFWRFSQGSKSRKFVTNDSISLQGSIKKQHLELLQFETERITISNNFCCL